MPPGVRTPGPPGDATGGSRPRTPRVFSPYADLATVSTAGDVAGGTPYTRSAAVAAGKAPAAASVLTGLRQNCNGPALSSPTDEPGVQKETHRLFSNNWSGHPPRARTGPLQALRPGDSNARGIEKRHRTGRGRHTQRPREPMPQPLRTPSMIPFSALPADQRRPATRPPKPRALARPPSGALAAAVGDHQRAGSSGRGGPERTERGSGARPWNTRRGLRGVPGARAPGTDGAGPRALPTSARRSRRPPRSRPSASRPRRARCLP
jgi:hypothetical protein